MLLIDGRAERRSVLRAVVETGEQGGTVVGETSTLLGALAAIDRHHVEVAVIEIQMPVPDGLAIIAALRAAHPTLIITVCSFHDNLATRQLAQDAGATAYLGKPVSSRDLHRAIRASSPPVGNEEGSARNGPVAPAPRRLLAQPVA